MATISRANPPGGSHRKDRPILTYLRTREAHLEHEIAKTELKKLVPADTKEAVGHGVKAKDSKPGAIILEALTMETPHAPIQ